MAESSRQTSKNEGPKDETIRFRDLSDSVASKSRGSSSNPRTSSLARSRYVPAQIRKHGTTQLPWLKTTISVDPAPRIHDLAIARFFAHYVLYPNRHIGDDGYLADLPYFYARSSDSSCIQYAVRACALASYANLSHSETLATRARKAYGEALAVLQKDILDPVAVKRDETLLAILVLDFFGPLTEDQPSFVGPHAAGLEPILQKRGMQQIKGTVGWNLFRIARRRVTRRSVQQKLAPMADFWEWHADMDPNHVEVSLSHAAISVARVCASIDKSLGSIGDDLDNDIHLIRECITELKQVEEEIAQWPAGLPLSWLPIPNPTSTESSQTTQWQDIWVANSWNEWHWMRLQLQETLCSCYKQLEDSDTLTVFATNGFRQATIEGAEAIGAILDNIPFMLEESDRMYPMKEVGYYYAYGNIDMILVSSLATEEQMSSARELQARLLRQWRYRS